MLAVRIRVGIGVIEKSIPSGREGYLSVAECRAGAFHDIESGVSDLDRRWTVARALHIGPSVALDGIDRRAYRRNIAVSLNAQG